MAGILTPLALYLINWGTPAQAPDSSNAVRALLFGISFLFVLGIALFRSISPPVYGAAIAVTCFAVPFGRSATLYKQSFAIVDRVEEIRRAELAYASPGRTMRLLATGRICRA